MYRIGAELWPPRAFWTDAVMFWTIAALGVCCFVAAAVSVGKQRSRYEKSQRKQRKQREAARKAQTR
jgi:hypothetical protein